MTQLFDTTTYDHDDQTGRHLRSIPVDDQAGSAADRAARTTQWRLDQHTIEVGRKGIQAARDALRAAARDGAKAKPARRAA